MTAAEYTPPAPHSLPPAGPAVQVRQRSYENDRPLRLLTAAAVSTHERARMTGPQLTTRYTTVDSSADICPQCATTLEFHARFCFECGARVATAPTSAAGTPQPLAAPADTIPLDVDDLEEIRFGEILEIESCVQSESSQESGASGEPDLVSLAFSPARRTPVLTSAHTQVVGAIRLEIDTSLDESELDPEDDLVPAAAATPEPEPGRVTEEEVDVDLDELEEPAPEPAADAHEGTVVAMVPSGGLPFWPAPPRGETVIAAAPPEPPPGYARWSA